jgi:hypothetical protein
LSWSWGARGCILDGSEGGYRKWVDRGWAPALEGRWVGEFSFLSTLSLVTDKGIKKGGGGVAEYIRGRRT